MRRRHLRNPLSHRYLVSDMVEVVQGDFSVSPEPHLLRGSGFPLFVLGLAMLVHDWIPPRATVGAVAFAYSFVFSPAPSSGPWSPTLRTGRPWATTSGGNDRPWRGDGCGGNRVRDGRGPVGCVGAVDRMDIPGAETRHSRQRPRCPEHGRSRSVSPAAEMPSMMTCLHAGSSSVLAGYR
jgi:hypothetical protein